MITKIRHVPLDEIRTWDKEFLIQRYFNLQFSAEQLIDYINMNIIDEDEGNHIPRID